MNSAKPRTNKWLIGLGGSYVWLLWTSIARCYSVFYDPLLQHFNSDYAGVSRLNAFAYIGYGISAVYAPVLLKRFGYRATVMSISFIGTLSILVGSFSNSMLVLSMCLGLIPGLCMGPMTVTYFCLICKFSDKTSSYLTQLLCLGGAVGPFVSCPLFQILIDSFGWRGALMIVSGLFLNAAVTGATLRPDLSTTDDVGKVERVRAIDEKCVYEDRRSTKARNCCCQKLSDLSNYMNLSLLKSATFWSFTLSYAGYGIAYLAVTAYIIPYGTKVLGLSEIVASTLICGISVGDGVSKIMHGLFYPKLSNTNRLLGVAASDLFLAIFLFMLPFSNSYVVLMFICVMIGLIGGGILGDYILQTRDEFSIDIYAYVNGYCCATTYSIMSAAQVLTGFSIDQTGNMGMGFYIGGAFALCSTLCHLILFKISPNRQTTIRENVFVEIK